MIDQVKYYYHQFALGMSLWIFASHDMPFLGWEFIALLMQTFASTYYVADSNNAPTTSVLAVLFTLPILKSTFPLASAFDTFVIINAIAHTAELFPLIHDFATNFFGSTTADSVIADRIHQLQRQRANHFFTVELLQILFPILRFCLLAYGVYYITSIEAYAFLFTFIMLQHLGKTLTNFISINIVHNIYLLFAAAPLLLSSPAIPDAMGAFISLSAFILAIQLLLTIGFLLNILWIDSNMIMESLSPEDREIKINYVVRFFDHIGQTLNIDINHRLSRFNRQFVYIGIDAFLRIEIADEYLARLPEDSEYKNMKTVADGVSIFVEWFAREYNAIHLASPVQSNTVQSNTVAVEAEVVSEAESDSGTIPAPTEEVGSQHETHLDAVVPTITDSTDGLILPVIH